MLNVMPLFIVVNSVHSINVVMLMAAGDHDDGGDAKDGGRSTLC